MTASAGEQAKSNHTVEDNHHRGKHRISSQPAGGLASRDHERHDERDLNACDRKCQHQRAIGLTHSVSNNFRVKDGREDARNKARDKKDLKQSTQPDSVPCEIQDEQNPSSYRAGDRPDG